MDTVVIQIGNSDDKLSQSRWSEYCTQVDYAIRSSAVHVHFNGTSPGDAPWQNAAWIFEMEADDVDDLIYNLVNIRQAFGQESIAIQWGETKFI